MRLISLDELLAMSFKAPEWDYYQSDGECTPFWDSYVHNECTVIKKRKHASHSREIK